MNLTERLESGDSIGNFPIVLLAIGAVVFVCIYGWAVVIVAQGIYRRVRPTERPPRARRHRIVRTTVLALAVLGLLCIADAFWIEPYWLEVQEIQIPCAKLPKGSRPIRIVHISDLHSDPSARLEEQLPRVIAGLHPDIIAFTGDAANSPQGLPVFRKCMQELTQIAPVYGVRGNWDPLTERPHRSRNGSPGKGNVFYQTGVHELDGRGVLLNIGATPLWLTGIHSDHMPPWNYWSRKVLDGRPPDALTVLLYHYPAEARLVAAGGQVDVYLAGHTHGGQIPIRAIWMPMMLSSRVDGFVAGLYQVDGMYLHVSRGIGMVGNAPRVRFMTRPVVTCIELVPQ